MTLRHRWFAGLAKQLGHPSGARGRLIGALLNSRNRVSARAAVTALALAPGGAAADVGFGGGVGLELLLKAVGRSGRVHGIDVSETMLSAAGRRFRREIAAGRMRLHCASITRLPLEDDSLDGLITVNTIYFIDDLFGACAELARVVKPSGRVVVGLADPDTMADLPYTAFGFRTRPLPEVVQALATAGLILEDDRRVGEGDGAFHLLVTALTGPD